LAALALGAACTSFADDVTVPPWRGAEGSTFQQWRFDTDANPANPEVVNNPYGNATANITVGYGGTGWQYQLEGLGSKTGYWDIGGDGGSIVLNIANRPQPLPFKEIWVQVTYFSDISQAPVVDIPGATMIGGQTVTVEQVPTGGSWLLDQSVWRMYPNPQREDIFIISDATWGSVVDQIVVDTICVPEPATLATLVLGGSGLLIRRRRR